MLKKRTPVEKMALYGNSNKIWEIVSKQNWQLEEVDPYSHMHYLGTEALDNAAKKLQGQFVNTIMGDFLEIDLDNRFDCAISLLAILHIPLIQRKQIFKKAYRCLKSGGKIYVEDYYQKNCLTDIEKNDLEKIVSCPGLPTIKEYKNTLENAGFNVELEDVTDIWTDFVVSRTKTYAESEEPNSSLLLFYQTVEKLFKGNNLGGIRITGIKTN
ncbi:MAG: methyltransferase domain-containing protein [Proteobacteria bacterium]|nr:methyltransferase domain-containing protein [Pseudomonadota bacterium]